MRTKYKFERKRPHGRPRRRWKSNIKNNHKQARYGGKAWWILKRPPEPAAQRQHVVRNTVILLVETLKRKKKKHFPGKAKIEHRRSFKT
jgi:hypothetical protein